jgi:hypothetical protein
MGSWGYAVFVLLRVAAGHPKRNATHQHIRNNGRIVFSFLLPVLKTRVARLGWVICF